MCKDRILLLSARRETIPRQQKSDLVTKFCATTFSHLIQIVNRLLITHGSTTESILSTDTICRSSRGPVQSTVTSVIPAVTTTFTTTTTGSKSNEYEWYPWSVDEWIFLWIFRRITIFIICIHAYAYRTSNEQYDEPCSGESFGFSSTTVWTT